MNPCPLEVRSSRITDFSLIFKEEEWRLCTLTPSPPLSLEDGQSTVKEIWLPKGHENALGSHCMLSFLYNDDKSFIKTWWCTWHWALFFAHISLLYPHNNSVKWMSLLGPGYLDLEKVSNWNSSEIGILTYICLTPKFEFKASNSQLFFWIRTALHS